MAKQTITVNRVEYYAPDNTVHLILDETIPAIVKDDTGAFIVGESSDIYINRSAFLAQAAEANTLFADYFSVREEPMTKGPLNAVFRHSEMVVERELHKPGETIGEYVVENQMFTTKVLSIEFSSTSISGMKAKIEAAFQLVVVIGAGGTKPSAPILCYLLLNVIRKGFGTNIKRLEYSVSVYYSIMFVPALSLAIREDRDIRDLSVALIQFVSTILEDSDIRANKLNY